MTSQERQVQKVGSDDMLTMQRSIDDFIASYHNSQPHADVARLEDYFSILHAKPIHGSDYTELPVDLSYRDAPVQIVRADPSRSHQETGNPILDARTGVIYYVFVGEDKETPFAQLADNSNQWGTFSTDGRFERLSDENYRTIQRIMSDAGGKVYEYKFDKERKASRRKHAVIGTLGAIAAIGFLGGAVGFALHRQAQSADELKNRINAFDNYWADKQIPATAYLATNGQVHNVSVVTDTSHLVDAPEFSKEYTSVSGPRKTTLNIHDGRCGTLSNVDIKDDDTVAMIALPGPNSIPPIGFTANSDNDTINVCAFDSGDKVDLVFQVIKKK